MFFIRDYNLSLNLARFIMYLHTSVNFKKKKLSDRLYNKTYDIYELNQ